MIKRDLLDCRDYAISHFLSQNQAGLSVQRSPTCSEVLSAYQWHTGYRRGPTSHMHICHHNTHTEMILFEVGTCLSHKDLLLNSLASFKKLFLRPLLLCLTATPTATLLSFRKYFLNLQHRVTVFKVISL